MIKVEAFVDGFNDIDTEINEWITRHPNITIKDIKFAFHDNTKAALVIYEVSNNE